MSMTGAISAGATFLAFDQIVGYATMENSLKNAGVGAISSYIGDYITPSFDFNSSGGMAELMSCAIKGGVYMGISQLASSSPAGGMLSQVMYGTVMFAASDAAVRPIVDGSGLSGML